MGPQLVTTSQEHFCGRCREIIPTGSRVWEIPVPIFTVNPWGKERLVTVKVWYHPEHWGDAKG